MQPQMFIILGINMILGFTSKAAQLWEDPSLIHTLWAPWRWVAHLCSYNRMHSKAPLARKLKYVEITITCKNGRRSRWPGMCSRKSHVVNVQYFLHGDNSQWCLLYRYMDGVLHWACLSDKDNWLKVAPHIMISPAFTYSFDFWMLTKCPMFANEQWNKAPCDLFGSPILMLIIPLTFLMMASLLHWLSLPAKIDRHTCMRHHRALSGARPSFSCLGRSKDAKTSGTRNYSTPKIKMGRIKY